MAKKKLIKKIKLQIPAGKANPAPPIGPALGAAGVNMMGFCKEFNDRTKDQAGELLPTEILVYADKSFTFITKQPPMSKLILKVVGLSAGSKIPNRDKVAKMTRKQMREVADKKFPDLGVRTIDSAMRMVEGTANSMGIECEAEETN